jgi:ATP-dependent Clp protease adaptor protein ClpS
MSQSLFDEASVVVRTKPSKKKRQGTKNQKKPRQVPRYHVILWDDPDHTYDYVITMMKRLFGYSDQRGFEIAKEVDGSGKAICITTTLEHGELKRDQIHAFGHDIGIPRCKGSMTATIEPAE